MKLRELIEDSLTEEDLRGVLDKLNLDRSGSRNELREKVLNGIEGKSASEALSSFPRKALIRICEAKGVEHDWPFFRDLDERIVKKLCSEVLDKDEPKIDSGQSIRHIEPSALIRKDHQEPDNRPLNRTEIKITRHPKRIISNFEEVVRDIEEWAPRIKHDHEDGYRDELNPWLWSRGHRTMIRKGDSTVSVLVDDKYPVIIAVEPDLSDFHRAFGQIHRHLEGFQSAIMVICRPKQDGETEFFEDRLRRSLAYSPHPHRVIKKH